MLGYRFPRFRPAIAALGASFALLALGSGTQGSVRSAGQERSIDLYSGRAFTPHTSAYDSAFVAGVAAAAEPFDVVPAAREGAASRWLQRTGMIALALSEAPEMNDGRRRALELSLFALASIRSSWTGDDVSAYLGEVTPGDVPRSMSAIDVADLLALDESFRLFETVSPGHDSDSDQ